MKYKHLKRIETICAEYRWESDGLTTWIEYTDCKELLVDILNIDSSKPIGCTAVGSLYVEKFDQVLSHYLEEEDIMTMFPKSEN